MRVIRVSIACVVVAAFSAGEMAVAFDGSLCGGAVPASGRLVAREAARVPSSGGIRNSIPSAVARRGDPATLPQEAAGGTQPGAGETPSEPASGFIDPREGGLEVTLGEWAVILEADTIRPGPVTFVVKNRGARSHGFRVRSQGGRGRDRFEARTQIIQPGGESALSVNLKTGTYRVDCFVEEAGVGDHAMLGMRAILTVSVDAPSAKPVKAPASSTVLIEGFSFAPSILTVPRGATVVWTNRDPAPHTITSEKGLFDSGSLPQGGEFRHRFDAPGEFPYKCLIHPAMTGTIKVE